MSAIFNTILFQPILNILIFIYNLVPGHDFGVAIIILTILIRLVLSPLSVKMLRSQREMSKLQPKIREINEKYKNDKQASARATMELYKEHKVNPFGGCFPILIQIPILFALFKAFRLGLNPEGLVGLYSFIKNPGVINNISLGFIDLDLKSPVLAIMAGALQWVQSKLASRYMTANPNPSKKGSSEIATAMMSKQMLYFLPIMVIIIAWGLPAGLVIYWVVTTIFSIFEQLYINKIYYSGQPGIKQSDN